MVESDDGSSLDAGSNIHFAAERANCVTRNGQPHADAYGILRADERLEHIVFNLSVDSVSLVFDYKFECRAVIECLY